MYGTSPSLLVFARRVDGDLAGLARKLDTFLSQHPKTKARAAVIVLTAKHVEVKELLEKLAKDEGLRNVPLCVTRPQEAARGPGEFDLDPAATFTAVAYDGDKTIRIWRTADALTTEAQEELVREWSKLLGVGP